MDCSEAIKLEPNNPQAYHLRGLCQKKLMHLREAMDDLGEAIRLDPGRADSYLLRG